MFKKNTSVLRVLAILIVLFVFFTESVKAQFPYTEDFKRSAANTPDLVLGAGTASAPARLTGDGVTYDLITDPVGNGYLRLTNNGANQAGFARSLTSFPSANGISISFEYFTHTSSGGSGDGISFFLFDALAAPTFNIGGFGGSLGYDKRTDQTLPGVSKGFLGIGFDEFGNFSNPIQGRTGGPGGLANSITLRGDGDGLTVSATNYEYLTHLQTTVTATNGSTFPVAGLTSPRSGDFVLLPSEVGYRKARIVIEKIPATSNFKINVFITATVTVNDPIVHQVITDYVYTPGSIPDNLMFGFAASTGGAKNFHEIRSIEVIIPGSVPRTPTAVADVNSTFKNTARTFSITSNDKDENGNATIDLTTVDLEPTSTGTRETSKTISGQGTFTVDNLGNITFTPVTGFTGTVTPIEYSFKDKGINDGGTDIRTSNTVSVSISVHDFTITNANAGVCVGTTPALITFSGGLSGSPYQYSIDFDGTAEGQGFIDVSNATLTAGSISVTVPGGAIVGTYSGNLTIRNSTTLAVTSIIPITVQLSNAPTTPVSSIVGGVSSTACVNVGVPLTSNSATGNQWYKDGVIVNGATSQTYSAIASGTYTVIVTASGCISAASNGTAVTINPLPSTPSNVNGQNSVCPGATGITYSVTAENGHTYTWTYSGAGATITSGAVTNSITVSYSSSATSGTWSVVAVNTASACTSLPRTYAVTVTTTPQPGPITSPVAAICFGTGGYVYSVPLVASTSYNWTYSGTGATFTTGGTSSITVAYAANATNGTWSVVATDASSCPSLPVTSSAVSGTVAPTASISYAGSPYCPSGIASVTQTGTSGGTYSSTTGLIIDAITGAVNLANSTAGTYTVTYTFTSGGCTAVATSTLVINAFPVVAAITGTGTVTIASTSQFANITTGGTWSSSNTAIATVNSSGLVTGVAAGSATITYTVTSGGCSTAVTKTITVSAGPSNTPPVTVADSYTVIKGATLTVVSPGVLSNDTDANSNSLTAIIVSNPANGTLTFNSNGSFTYVHNNGTSTSDSFTYKANDGTADGNIVTVTIAVTVNTPPVAVADTYTVTKGATITVGGNGVLINDTDTEGNTLTAIKLSDPTHGTLSLNSNGSFTYVHNGGTATSDSFTYKVNDGIVDGNTVTVSITIAAAANSAPLALIDSYNVSYNTLTTISAPGVLGNDTDINNNPMTAIKVTNPAQGTLTFNSNGSFTYLHHGGTATSDSFTYKVNDGIVDGNTVVVTLNIVRPNAAPIAVADSYVTTKGSTLTITTPGVLFNDTDADNNTLTAIKVSNPTNGILVLNSNGSFTYVHDNGSSTSDSFAYKVNDGTVDGNTVTVTITLATPGIAPVITDINRSGFKNQDIHFTLLNFSEKFVDILHTIQKVKIVSLPPTGTLKLNGVNITAGQEVAAADLDKITFTPLTNLVGTLSFIYSATCTYGLSSTNRNVNITIIEPGAAPIAVADTYTVTRGSTLTIAIPGVLRNDTDPDGLPLSAIKVTDPANGALILYSNGSFTYVHNGSAPTSDSFTYKVNDGFLDGNTVTVTLNIPVINPPPVLDNFSKSGNNALPIPFTLANFVDKFTDTDPLVKIKIVTLPTTGILKLNGVPVFANQEIVEADIKGLSFEPPLHWNGTTSFLWNASDGSKYATSNATVSIQVTQPSDPNAKIGLAKQLATITPNLNGSYDVKFIFTLVNYGTFDLINISVRDNLSLAFGGAQVSVKLINGFGNLKANTSYNGFSDTELLLNSSRLVGGEEAKIELLVNVRLVLTGGIFQNTATAEALSNITGFKVNDVSTNGLKPDPNLTADVSPSEVTTIKLDLLPAYVPPGFSPNGDGINDKFVVQNAGGKLVALEMYNRWGNRVYKSKDYKNDWGGEVTEGIFLGKDIPDGTYYYIIIIDNKDRYAGFITVNR
jgi:gliding motility-associated-like protein